MTRLRLSVALVALIKYLSPDSADVRTHNRMALAGFCLGLVSILWGGLLGLLPIAAIVCSAIGLGTFNADTQKNKWMAGVGLGIGIVYTLAYMQIYGYLDIG